MSILETAIKLYSKNLKCDQTLLSLYLDVMMNKNKEVNFDELEKIKNLDEWLKEQIFRLEGKGVVIVN